MQGFLHTIPRGRNFTMCGGGEILIFNSDFSEFAWFNMGEVRDLPECEIALILVSCEREISVVEISTAFGSVSRTKS